MSETRYVRRSGRCTIRVIRTTKRDRHGAVTEKCEFEVGAPTFGEIGDHFDPQFFLGLNGPKGRYLP